MKAKYLFYLLLAGLVFPLHSQTQITSYCSYFGEHFTKWYTYHEYYDVSLSDMYSVDTRDTLLLNGLFYKKLTFNYSNEIVNGYYYFGVREEVETGSLFVNTDGVSEVLVSKMDMEIGDKFYFPPPKNVEYNPSSSSSYSMYFLEGLHTNENGYYAIVDSIYYKDNRKHIRMDVNYHAFLYDISLTFIEGIGPNISFGPFLDYGYFWYNVCFICNENENELWKNADFIKYPENFMGGSDCLFNSMGNPNIKADFPFELIQRKNEIQLQPNVMDFEFGCVYMYSMQGKLLYEQQIQMKANVIISTSHLPNGTYIILFTDDKTTKLWIRKVII